MTDETSRFADTLEAGGTTYTYYPVAGIPGSETLPYALTVLLENALRNAESSEEAEELAGRIVAAGNAGEVGSEVEFSPARVLFQDFTGVPLSLIHIYALSAPPGEYGRKAKTQRN